MNSRNAVELELKKLIETCHSAVQIELMPDLSKRGWMLFADCEDGNLALRVVDPIRHESELKHIGDELAMLRLRHFPLRTIYLVFSSSARSQVEVWMAQWEKNSDGLNRSGLRVYFSHHESEEGKIVLQEYQEVCAETLPEASDLPESVSHQESARLSSEEQEELDLIGRELRRLLGAS